jgi:Rad3-related DNA helicase
LPSEGEVQLFKLKNVISREDLKDMQERDKENENVNRFKKKQIDILFSTKCTRGVDFPGDECNSIIFTKYPNPDVKSPFWNILKKTNPTYYWDFYKDKARRELFQRVYRGIRFKGDHVYVLSPDERVLNSFE